MTTYLWSHVEPSTAILCACIMTYRPLFIGFKESLQSRFSKSEGLSKGKLWNASVSDSNSNSDQSRSHTEPMQWPVGRGLRGQPDLKYQNLDRRATNDKPHAIQIPPKQQDPTPDDAEYKCATIAVGREASPVWEGPALILDLCLAFASGIGGSNSFLLADFGNQRRDSSSLWGPSLFAVCIFHSAFLGGVYKVL